MASATSLEEVHGRAISKNADVYQLPADSDEFHRLDSQHVMFQDVMGRYPRPLYQALAKGEPRSALDLGCGSGSWTYDLARDFPHVDVFGLDLVALKDGPTMPPNLKFEVGNINDGLDHITQKFDVIHARLIASGVKNFEALIDDCSRLLKPGGFLLIVDCDFKIYASKDVAYDEGPDAAWLARWFGACNAAIRKRGGSPDAAVHLERWMTEHDALENVVATPYYIECSPFKVGADPESRRRRVIGSCMRDDIRAFLKSGRPLLLGNGMKEEELEVLENNTLKEIAEAITPVHVMLPVVYANRKRS